MQVLIARISFTVLPNISQEFSSSGFPLNINEKEDTLPSENFARIFPTDKYTFYKITLLTNIFTEFT